MSIIRLSVTVDGVASVYTSNLFQPSIAFHCGSIDIIDNSGFILLDPSQLTAYENSNVIYVTLTTSSSPVNISVMASIIDIQSMLF